MIVPVNLSTGALAGAARVATFAIARQRFLRIVFAYRDDVSGSQAVKLATVARGSTLHEIEIQKQYRIAELFGRPALQLGCTSGPSWRRKAFPS